jgi:hypothetical protein
VHLRDGGGRQRLDVEAFEHRLGLVAQVLAQLRSQVVDRHRRHVAVQARELGDPVGAEQVGAAGEDLTQLHEGGAELLDGQARLHRRFEPRQVGGMVAVQGVAGALQCVGQAEPAHRVAEAVARQDAGDLVQSSQVTGRPQRLDQHVSKYGPDTFREGLTWDSST